MWTSPARSQLKYVTVVNWPNRPNRERHDMMLKMSGFDRITKTLEEAAKAVEGIDGELGSVSFDPNDPGSIETAIAEIARIVDDKLGGYESNPIVAQMADAMKESYRQGILEKAAAARLEDDQA
jgi:hypothetical protein